MEVLSVQWEEELAVAIIITTGTEMGTGVVATLMAVHVLRESISATSCFPMMPTLVYVKLSFP
jgi:hypothetical protein